jgi:hypothetical protein
VASCVNSYFAEKLSGNTRFKTENKRFRFSVSFYYWLVFFAIPGVFGNGKIFYFSIFVKNFNSWVVLNIGCHERESERSSLGIP